MWITVTLKWVTCLNILPKQVILSQVGSMIMMKAHYAMLRHPAQNVLISDEDFFGSEFFYLESQIPGHLTCFQIRKLKPINPTLEMVWAPCDSESWSKSAKFGPIFLECALHWLH